MVLLPVDDSDDAEDAAVEFGMQPPSVHIYQNGGKVQALDGAEVTESAVRDAIAAFASKKKTGG